MDLGWTVLDAHTRLLCHRGEEEEVCIICLDECNDLHIKRSCCNARYHRDCYNQAIKKSSRCPMCRTPIL